MLDVCIIALAWHVFRIRLQGEILKRSNYLLSTGISAL